MTDSEQVAAAVRIATERFGGLDVAFANAGVFGDATPIVDYPEDVFDARDGGQRQGLVPRGQARAGGHARRRQPDLQLERRRPAVRRGDRRLRDLQARDRRAHAHRGAARWPTAASASTAIHPGPVDNRFQHRIEVIATGAPEDRAAELFEERIPLARHAAPEEIARSVLFLASDDSSFVTATTLSVDGGLKG